MATTKDDITGTGDAAKQATENIDKLNKTLELTPEELMQVGDAAEHTASQLKTLSGSVDLSQRALNGLNTITASAGSLLNSFDNAIQGASISLNTTQALTDKQTTQFSLLSNSVFGARESYAALAGTDFSGFKNQISDLMKVATESPLSVAGKQAKEIWEKWAAAASGKAATEIGKMSTETLKKLSDSLITSADNALKLQTGFINLAVKTGNLDSVFSLAGPNLENINVLLEKQADMMSKTAQATGVSKETVEKYYAALGTVPGALASIVASTKAGDNSVTMLTAAMKVASGTGRDFTDVVDDLKIAFRNYGMTGDGALRFSAQISDVTQNLGVELDTVKNALRGGSEAFKMFAHTGDSASQMASGLASIMNNYGKALESTGLQGTQAVDVVSNMTKQIGQMSIAQKSFLSQQTGGAGGLMGAFQIDKMMRDGDVKGVFEKVRQQMQKQFGQIVTVNEASQSEAAANQMTRQITMLRQGPLGQFARSNEEAESILEGFKATQEGRGGGAVGPDVLKNAMDRGTSIQEKSYTVAAKMGADIAEIRSKADIGTLTFLQKGGLTAGQGRETLPGEMKQSEDVRKAAENLRSSMSRATNMNRERFTGSYAEVNQTGNLIDTSGKDAVTALAGLKDSFKILPLSIKGITDELMKTLSSGNLDNAKEQEDLLKERIRGLKASTSSGDMQTLNAIATLENASNMADTAISSGATVGVAANNAANRGVAALETPAQTKSPNATPAVGSVKQDIMVHVNGFCLKCKQEMEVGHQANGVAPQAR